METSSKTSGLPTQYDGAGDRPFGREAPPGERFGMVTVRDLDHQFVSVGIGDHDGCEVGGDEVSGPRCDEGERLIGSRPGEDGVGDVPHRVEPALPTPRLLIEPGVVDRDAGLRCEHEDGLLVLLAELRCSQLFRQIDVPEDLSASDDRRAEKRPHLRVVWRKP